MRKIDPIYILLDEPIGGMTEDRQNDLAGLGFSEYADVLAGVILGSASPFTMGVFGDWGTGKTTLMRMIETRMEPYAPGKELPKKGYPTIIPVWFDAWRYEREDDLIGPLLGAMLDAADEHDEHPTGKVLVEALGSAFRTLVSSVSVKLPVMEVSGKEFVEQYDRFVDRLALPGSTEYRRAYRILQEAVEGFAAPADKAKPNNKFVVFVDDLDRCLPEAALLVLECTKVFLGFKGMVWVLGLKREIIENCILEHHRGKGADQTCPYGEDLGRQYLQKIIQVPFTIPAGTADEMALVPEHLGPGERLPEGLDEEFCPLVSDDGLPKERRPIYEEFDERPGLPPFEQSYHVAAHYLEKKPRELKRLLNAYMVSARITQASLAAHCRRQYEEANTEPSEEIIAEYVQENFTPMLTLALLVLSFLSPKLYDRLTMGPTLMPLRLTWRAAQSLDLKEAPLLGQEAFACAMRQTRPNIRTVGAHGAAGTIQTRGHRRVPAGHAAAGG